MAVLERVAAAPSLRAALDACASCTVVVIVGGAPQTWAANGHGAPLALAADPAIVACFVEALADGA